MSRTSAPENETKRAKFIRLANQRTNKAIKAIGTLSGLSNRNLYEFSVDDAANIKAALDAATEEFECKMGGDGETPNDGFEIKT